MPPDEPVPELSRIEKLSLIFCSSRYERIHFGLVLASAAAAIGLPVTLFFTQGAVQVLADTAPSGSGPGWRALSTEDGRTSGSLDDDYVRRGVASMEELLRACADLGCRFLVCDMGLRITGLDAEKLSKDFPIEVTGAVTLLGEATPQGQMLIV